MSWIEARLNCSCESAWTILRETILSDLDEWRTLTRAKAGSPVVASEGKRITVTLGGDAGEIWVSVQKTERRITVRRPDPSKEGGYVSFDLIPRLNDAGECRLWLGERELEFWQASRQVLEPVLFP